MDFEEGSWLLVAQRGNAHRQLGYGSFTEYIERLFGYAPRVTRDKLRVARALQQLPELSRELREGRLSFSHVRELTRVATPQTENIWLESARGRSSRQVEKLVSGHGPGSLPHEPKDSKLERHVLRFEGNSLPRPCGYKRAPFRLCAVSASANATRVERSSVPARSFRQISSWKPCFDIVWIHSAHEHGRRLRRGGGQGATP
jgi:hypothetical protein